MPSSSSAAAAAAAATVMKKKTREAEKEEEEEEASFKTMRRESISTSLMQIASTCDRFFTEEQDLDYGTTSSPNYEFGEERDGEGDDQSIKLVLHQKVSEYLSIMQVYEGTLTYQSCERPI